jgi:hypothetical protein
VTDESSGTSNDGAGVSGADVAVARALASAVLAGGSRLSSEPRRVQGMVNDVLGAQARTRRAEVDAVVLAAEEAVPDDLMSGRIDVDEALERLRVRGLDGGVALFAVDVWRYALGMLGDHSVPPTLSNSLETTSLPTVTDSAPASLTESDPGATVVVGSGRSGEPVPAGTAQPIVHGGAGSSAPGTGPTRSTRRWLAGSAAALIAALVVALIVVLAGGRDEPLDADELMGDAVTTPETGRRSRELSAATTEAPAAPTTVPSTAATTDEPSLSETWPPVGECSVSLTGELETQWIDSSPMWAASYFWDADTGEDMGEDLFEVSFSCSDESSPELSVYIYATEEANEWTVPFGPATYALTPLNDSLFYAFVFYPPELSEGLWAVAEPGGTLTIERFDEGGIAGWFDFPMWDLAQADSVGTVWVTGTFVMPVTT